MCMGKLLLIGISSHWFMRNNRNRHRKVIRNVTRLYSFTDSRCCQDMRIYGIATRNRLLRKSHKAWLDRARVSDTG
jgi:hypothetical protein